MIYFIIRQLSQPSSTLGTSQLSGSTTAPVSEPTVPVQPLSGAMPQPGGLEHALNVVAVKK